MKQTIKQILPVALIICIAMVMSLFLYQSVTAREKESCWALLKDSANSVTKEMQITFAEDINLLRLAAHALGQDGADRVDTSALRLYCGGTTFSRVDVIYPGDRLVLENGREQALREDLSFDALAQAGEHMSARMIDTETGKEAVYYFVPVEKDGETAAVLAGVLESAVLAEEFHPAIYDGNASYCIVDSRDGNYVMDTWHDELGNVYTTPTRTRVKGYENVNLKEDIKAQNTGVVAFESRTTGKPLYMYYMPLGMFDWELLVFVQEDVVFAKLLYLRRLLIFAGIVEAGLLLLYFFWNLRQVKRLRRSRAETLEQLAISNTLLECVTALSSGPDIDTAIGKLLEVINDHFQADRAYIFLQDGNRAVFVNTYEYDRPNVQRQMATMPELPASALANALQSFQKAGVCYIPDTEQEKGHEISPYFAERNIKSVLAVPIGRGDENIGFVSVDNPKESYDDATLLTSIRFFISNSLETKAYQDRLQFMSYWDGLTSFYNRNKYLQELAAQQKRPLDRVGVVYLDLNGLKAVNDRKGHEAGDGLICAAARVIGGIYPGNAYRIGGDEFVVLAPDMEKELFEEKLRALGDEMDKQGISVSLGALWEEQCRDLDGLLKEADRRMYEAKAMYYARQTPEGKEPAAPGSV